MHSPQLAAPLHLWEREGNRRNVLLPAPGGRVDIAVMSPLPPELWFRRGASSS